MNHAMKHGIYVDTSVVGGCFDFEFQTWSNLLFHKFITGNCVAVLSDLTLQELETAPERVRNKILEIPSRHKRLLSVTDEINKLAETYILEGTLTNKSFSDTLHIALVTINNVDVLASWNFKHIVNLNRIRLYNSINVRFGYRIIEIRTPREILEENDDDESHERIRLR